MTISLNWLNDYLNIHLSPEEISEVLTSIGLEVEGMEKIETIPGGLEGVVVGHVLECGKHPNADKLSLTKVDIGSGEPLQIVCGAPNVAQGQKVLVATVGTTLHPLEGEPITLKKGKIRGEASEGMICAEDELGLGKDHSGILVLPDDTPIGQSARDYFNIKTDYVYEIGLTPNRSDATNHIGVAKDLAAALKINYGHSGEVKMPSVEQFKVNNHDLPIEVEVRNSEACPRYAGVSIKGLTVKESPDWLKNRLRSIGVRPISNMVDVTNFILHELGQPLHAFDLDKITNRKIIVQTLPEGSTFKSLDEQERTLTATDLMICDGAENGMCIGGVFGGINSGVTETTTNIFLEAAHFNPTWIRRSSMHHNLRTDAAKVFEKGSDPNICVYALKRAALLMQELGGGEIASEVVDVYPNKIEPAHVHVKYAHVHRLIGVKIPKSEIRAILDALEMELLAETETEFTVAVPTNKSDVTREADVIEEILRIYGLNKVPMPSHIRMSVSPGEHPSPSYLRNLVGDMLAANGFNEIMGLSLSESRHFKTMLPIPQEELVFIHNTSNVHLDIMRPTMLISGLEAILYNQNRQQLDLKLFEFGRSYRSKGDDFEEKQHLTLFLTGQRWAESWLAEHKKGVDYFTLKAFVKLVLDRIGMSGYQETAIQSEELSFGLKYHRGQQTLVEFGKVQPSLVKAMDIRNEVFYADFNWEALLKAAKKVVLHVEEPTRFPSVRRDLAVIVENSIKFEDIVAIARKAEKKLLKDVNLFDVYENADQLGAGKKSYAVSFVFENAEQTLRDKDIDKVMSQLIQSYEKQLGATIRR